MKKAKLFMMLALLVMGVSNVWGYQYRVFFESGVIKGGYTVTNTTYVTSGDDAYVLTCSRPLADEEDYQWVDGGWVYYYKVSDYISPRTVTGNTASISVSTNDNAKQMGFDGIIYINYNSNAAEVTTSDGVFKYSNIYQRDTYDRILLPDDQYAISLDPAYLSSNVNVSIPKTYNGKKVTAIQKWGFCEKVEHTSHILRNCSNSNQNLQYNNEDNSDESHYYNGEGDQRDRTNSHSNQYLKTVTFENASNLLSIGDYAFMSCTELTSIQIPSSVEYLGQGLFEQDEKLTTVTFQTTSVTRNGKTFTGVKFNTIRDYTFWLCSAIQSLSLPDGIEYIEGQTGGDSTGEAEGGGASLQYMTSLINIRLPNTLLRIGPHFLCSCKALRTLTIPVSVVYIDGACFHGCESLETVYILGPAAALKAAQGDDSNTFGANYTTCADPVNNCTFYTTTENLPGYQDENSVWSHIDNEGAWDVKTHRVGWGMNSHYEIDFDNSMFGNRLVAMGENRVIPDHWVTAIFPTKGSTTGTETDAVADRTKAFGAGTLVAEMEKCTGYTDDEIDGVKYRTYHLNFKLITGNTIPANKPVLIKAGKIQEVPYEFYTSDDQEKDWFATNASIDFNYYVEASDKAKIYMKGRYTPHLLEEGDFYFMDTKGNDGNYSYSFKRVPNQENAANIKGCRCWWTVEQNNMRSVNVGAKAASQRFFDDETTGIEELPTRVVIDAIYDLNGHKLNVKPEELPQGMFIINGKKVLKK